MKTTLIQARLATPLAPLVTEGAPLPTDIQWMPPGRHCITPLMGGEARTLELTVDAALAGKFAAQLRQLWAQARDGRGDEPFFDFNHADGEASGQPEEFYWGGDAPKTGGIRARIRLWTAAGRAALTGRSFRRFSPQWLTDQDTLLPVGIGANLGGLVNRAAFQTIQPVVARCGDLATPPHTMTDAEISAAMSAALKPLSDRLTALETKVDGALPNPNCTAATTTTQAADASQVARLEGRLKSLETAAGQVTLTQARSAVNLHAKRGAIPPQDADLLAFWEGRYQADPEGTEKVLARMPDNAALAAQITQAGGPSGRLSDGVQGVERLRKAWSNVN